MEIGRAESAEKALIGIDVNCWSALIMGQVKQRIIPERQGQLAKHITTGSAIGGEVNGARSFLDRSSAGKAAL